MVSVFKFKIKISDCGLIFTSLCFAVHIFNAYRSTFSILRDCDQLADVFEDKDRSGAADSLLSEISFRSLHITTFLLEKWFWGVLALHHLVRIDRGLGLKLQS